MKIELRDDGKVHISAYINVVERDSKPLRDISGVFIERVAAGTFERAIKNNPCIDLMFNHRRVLSDTQHGVVLYEDSIGLKCEADIDDPEVVEEARAGRLNECSFGFSVNSEKWSINDAGMRYRTLTDISLYEISVLNVPAAYIATAIDCRGEENVLREYRQVEDDDIDIPKENDGAEEPELKPDPEPVQETVRNYDALRALVDTYL